MQSVSIIHVPQVHMQQPSSILPAAERIVLLRLGQDRDGTLPEQQVLAALPSLLRPSLPGALLENLNDQPPKT